MPRPRSAETLARLRDAALDVFARQGFRRTRVGDVARRIRIAHGTVYGYAAGKEALFWLALRQPLPGLDELPLARPGAAALARSVEACAAELHALPELDAALVRGAAADGEGELTRIFTAHYEATRSGARELALLERNARELPAVARIMARQRRDLLARMQRYLESRITAGWVEPVADPGLAARAALDAVAHCARRHEEEPDPVFRPESLARDTVVGWAVRGLRATPRAPPPAPLH